MCGIAGICHFQNSGKISPELLKRMTFELNHRGPDERGIYLDDRVGLGHARLSIIDLSSGIQPMSNEDGSLWLIYNGEIFNYLEIRSELLKSGHRFATTSDSEVILHLYEEMGHDCLKRFNGQFAFAIWDNQKNELFLARDRVGIRPLYLTVLKDAVLFASEIKALLIHDQVPREIDPVALDQIFTFWTTLPGYTIFKNIQELPPGHYMKISNGQIQQQKYWENPFYPSEAFTQKTSDEIVTELRSLITDAVRIRLRADVPVGTYLSGGLDSSGISSLVVKNFNSEVLTFGIRFEEANFDEGSFQHDVVNYLNMNHTELVASNEKIGRFFPDVINHCEKPILRTSPVPLFLLSQKVQETGLKVVLTGEGADEYFGGYNIFREAKVRRFWARQPQSKWRGDLIGKLYPYIFKDARQKTMMKNFFARGFEDIDNPFYSHLIRWNNTARLKNYFSDDIRKTIGDYSSLDQLKQNLPRDFERWDSLAKSQYLETTLFMSNYLLSSQGDRVAMAHSVEIRLPFLDPRILEFMGKVPPNLKIRGLNEKFLLKKCFKDILPEKIYKRPKHPYRAPISSSLLNENSTPYSADLLSEKGIKNTGLFDPAKVARLISKLKTAGLPNETNDMGLVGILSTQLFYEQFIHGAPASGKTIPQDWHVIDLRSNHPKN